MIPEDRKTQGVLLNLPIYQNITLSYFAREKSFWIRRKQEEQMVASAIQDLSIRTPSMKTPVGSLSGGNQQKVVVAKWLLTAPDIILMDEPSRGIDIGAKFELYQLIDRLAAQGIAVVWFPPSCGDPCTFGSYSGYASWADRKRTGSFRSFRGDYPIV
jgi:ABC-type sugar transport system ATPase subunit